MSEGVNRREVLTMGAVAVAAAALPALGAFSRPFGPEQRIFFFDPSSSMAHRKSAFERHHRLVMLEGDPVRLWRSVIPHQVDSIGGITCWSDYVLLRGLAEERGKRKKAELIINDAHARSMILWEMS